MELFMLIWFRIFIFILGACLGSFLCCQVRRLHSKEQASQKGKHKALGHRSICYHCRAKLHWYENIPIISWLALRGRCHHCRKPIGRLEIVAELFTATAFLIVGWSFSPLGATLDQCLSLLLLLIFITILSFLAFYDAAYGELPTFALIAAIICALIILIRQQLAAAAITSFTPGIIVDPLCAVAILGGLYLILYLVSHGRWVGDGDWLLGVSLALVLASPWLALITLFLANFLACLFAVPQVISATQKRKPSRKPSTPAPLSLRVPLGPFMITAFILVYAFSDFLLLQL